jgi:hypothetical protein
MTPSQETGIADSCVKPVMVTRRRDRHSCPGLTCPSTIWRTCTLFSLQPVKQSLCVHNSSGKTPTGLIRIKRMTDRPVELRSGHTVYTGDIPDRVRSDTIRIFLIKGRACFLVTERIKYKKKEKTGLIPVIYCVMSRYPSCSRISVALL